MTDFVICIDDDWGPGGEELVTQYDGSLPVKGVVYTIRDVIRKGDFAGYRLEEIVNPCVCYGYTQEPSFIADQFRPVRDADLDIFKEMLNNVPHDTDMDREVVTNY